MISWLGKAFQCMLKMRPSPGSQSTVTTPLLIFQSVALLVSMVICACAVEAVRDKTNAIAARGRCFIGEGLQLSDGRRSGCRFELRDEILGSGIKSCQ